MALNPLLCALLVAGGDPADDPADPAHATEARPLEAPPDPDEREPPPDARTPKPDARSEKRAPLSDDQVRDNAVWMATIGGLLGGGLSACACGWLPFFGAPIVALAAGGGACLGGVIATPAGALDPGAGWLAPLAADAAIAGAGGLVGGGAGSALLIVAVMYVTVAQPQPSDWGQVIILGAMGGATVLTVGGVVAGSFLGARMMSSMAPGDPAQRDDE